MNRKLVVGAGAGIVGVAALAWAAIFAAANVSVSHECDVRFVYEDGVPMSHESMPGANVRDVDEWVVQNHRRSIAMDFGDARYPLPLDELTRRCLNDSALKKESESRARDVLASRRIEIVGVPRTNFAFSCRLVLSDHDSRNLGEYARFVLDTIKTSLDEDVKVLADKAAYPVFEQQSMVEQRITELEKNGGGVAGAERENELARLRQEVVGLRRRFDEVRSRAMRTSTRRISNVSKPKITLVFRVGEKERNLRVHSPADP